MRKGQRFAQRTRFARFLRWGVVVLGAGIVALFLWVGVRGALAAHNLREGSALADTLMNQALAGDSAAAEQTAVRLGALAQSATALTNDAGWRLLEQVPVLGPNLRAVHLAAEATSVLTLEVVVPQLQRDVAGTLTSLVPTGGKIDARTVAAQADSAASVSTAAQYAHGLVHSIDQRFLIAPLRESVNALTDAADTVVALTTAVNALTQVMPAMLGDARPRNTLLVFQNPAELRATGGLMGAMAVIHADGGRLSLVRQATAGQLNDVIIPPTEVLSAETRALFGTQPARLISDANVTPDFSQSAEIVAAVWQRTFGEKIDSVVSLDPVALSYILRATGSLELANGTVLSADNAVQYLLTDVYFQLDPTAQDAVFAEVAAAVFERIAEGDVDGPALIAAVIRSGVEHRVFLWNADATEQAFTASTTLAGLLPLGDGEQKAFGLYFNDATASKMDPYLTEDVQWGMLKGCREDGRETALFRVILQNTAPLDAATAFPGSVSGAGVYGTPAGNIRTSVMMFGPERGAWGTALVNGRPSNVFAASGASFAMAVTAVELAPGESTTVVFRMLMPAPGELESGESTLVTTPTLNIETNMVQFLDCTMALK